MSTSTTYPCPACGEPHATGQPLCEHCGFELVQNSTHTTAVDTTEVVAPARKRAKTDTQPLELPAALARPSVRLLSGLVSSEGVIRRGQPDEDSALSFEFCKILTGQPHWLGFYAVADGMGGHDAGEVASRLALEALAGSALASVAQPWLNGDSMIPEKLYECVHKAVEDAHHRVKAGNQAGGRDMGTTLTAALVIDTTLYVANVGDSRAYLFSPVDGQIRRVSHDQSLVQELVDAGELREDDVYTDPRRNIILASLGAESHDSGVEIFIEDLKLGDRILLCSDGLWEMIRDPHISDVVRTATDPQQCAEELIRLACKNGGVDNVTAVVVDVQARRAL